MTSKMLYLDIENSPLVAEVWGAYESSALRILEESRMLGFAYAWGDGPIKAVYPPAHDLYGSDMSDEHERSTLSELWDLLNEADIVIAHNGDRFDVKKINARFLKYGFWEPEPYRTVDTLKAARRKFSLPKNNLDYIGEYLGVGRKVSTGGYALWQGCIEGDPKAWKKMAKYNKQDIALLRAVYLKLRGWIDNHPHVGGDGCPACGSEDNISRGHRTTAAGLKYRQLQCSNCGRYYAERKADRTKGKPKYKN